jgi:hypothetical protein
MKKIKHHLKLPSWPNFIINPDLIDGYIPCCRVKIGKDFLKF